MNGIILAGGENRRMGTDKAFLEFCGRPMIERILEVFFGLFRRTIVVTNSPERYNGYGVEVVKDSLDVRGPLTGIYSGLQHSGEEYNFVAACDMPFLNERLIEFMVKASRGHDAVVPKVKGLTEPLHAVYTKRMLPRIESQLRTGERRIQELYKGIDVRYISEAEIVRYDPLKRSFKNVNTPEEYKEAVCSV